MKLLLLNGGDGERVERYHERGLRVPLVAAAAKSDIIRWLPPNPRTSNPGLLANPDLGSWPPRCKLMAADEVVTGPSRQRSPKEITMGRGATQRPGQR